MKLTSLIIALFVLSFGMAQVHAEHEQGDHKANKFEQADANKDGKVTFDEFKAQRESHLQKMFNRLDANQDGAIDATEHDAAKSKWQGNHPKGGRKHHDKT